ncbi:hypothetical protein HY837_03630 [archaeon]|nr:hypothetical protein [archaeon]
MTNEFVKVGRPGAIGSRKNEVITNYNKLYGENNWRLIHHINNFPVELPGVLALYEDAYFEYFKVNPEELDFIAENYENCYDNNVSNVNSGFDYTIQEYGGNHYQDIAIRRVLLRNGMWFKGKGLLEIRTSGTGLKWNPGELPFHLPELIVQPEFKGWWKHRSIESWYQSNKYLEVKKNALPSELSSDLIFVTTNTGKYQSAQKSLGHIVKLGMFSLDISEEQNSIEEIATHKAKVAYSVLCKPVLTDDSGFVIPKLNGYPGHHVGRELREKGINHFLNLAKQNGGSLEAYWPMTVAYFDETLDKPLLFTSKVEGTLISEVRGDVNNKNLKSPLGAAFIVKGQTKTIAEMTDEEYQKYARSDRWGSLAEFLKTRKQ